MNLIPFIILSMFIPIGSGFIHPVNAAEVNGAFMTKFVNDISGSDIFKTTVGLTNVDSNSGLVKICATPVSKISDNRVCNIIDAGREFQNNFGSSSCFSCIITVGTFVFPNDQVPLNSSVIACAGKITEKQTKDDCNETLNTLDRVPEDIVIKLQ